MKKELILLSLFCLSILSSVQATQEDAVLGASAYPSSKYSQMLEEKKEWVQERV